MRTATWGVRQVDVLEYRHLVDWANNTERYRDLPPLGDLPREQASLEKKPILGDLTSKEQAYIRAHWERRHMFRKTMDLMADGLWARDQIHEGDDGEIIMAEHPTSGPDFSDPALMQQLDEYRASDRFDVDYKRRMYNLTRTWAASEHEPYLFAPTQPYVYARAGALAVNSSFEDRQFTGHAVRDLLTLGGLNPREINAVHNLLVTHGIIEFCVNEDSFGPVRPNLIDSPMQVDPSMINHLAAQDFYNVPLDVAPQ